MNLARGLPGVNDTSVYAITKYKSANNEKRRETDVSQAVDQTHRSAGV